MIFLVVYFMFGLGSLMLWMFYVGLIIIVVDVLVVFVLINYGVKIVVKIVVFEWSGVLVFV